MAITGPRPSPRGVMNPSTSPASTSHGAVPNTISTATRASGCERHAPAAATGAHERPSHPQPRRAGDHDAGQLEHAVGGDELEERRAVAGPDRQARDAPNSTPW